MRFEADLDVVVDGTSAHVRGDGATLIVESDAPAAFVGSLRRTAGTPTRRQLTSVADGLAAAGASLHLDGPHGRFVTVGADADSFAVGVLTGTRHLSPGRRAVASSLADIVRRRRVVVAVAGLLVAAVALVRAR